MENNNNRIMLGAGPFHFEGNKIGILLIHGGGGGTCADLKPLVEDLHLKGGYTINIPLLPGYGTTPRDLKNTNINLWRSTINAELSLLNKTCDKIIVGGHSMGALLALVSAATHNLDGVFTIGAPIGIQKFLFHLVPIFKIFVRYHHIDSEKFKRETNGKWVGYDKIPLNITTKLKNLIKETKKSLSEISCPALIIQGRLDSDIKSNSIDYIYNNIKSNKKRKIWLEESYHPILDNPNHNQIIIALINFINELCT